MHNSVIRDDPTATSIPFYLVDAVVEVPYGSYPGNMPYLYFSDEEHLAEWLKVEKDPEEFEKFLDHYIYGCLQLPGVSRALRRTEEDRGAAETRERGRGLTDAWGKELDDMTPEYNMMELMICVASRYLEDGKTVAVGTGAPCAAAMLAQKT